MVSLPFAGRPQLGVGYLAENERLAFGTVSDYVVLEAGL